MTFTISLPNEWRPFFDQLAEDGYNRSGLMLKMVRMLRKLDAFQRDYPGGLPQLIEALTKVVDSGDFLRILQNQSPQDQELENINRPSGQIRHRNPSK